MKKKVLLVSSEALTRQIMTFLFEGIAEYQCAITEALTCSDGVKKVREEDFDLVVTDNHTLDDSQTGFDIVREALAKGAKPRVLMAASSLSEQDQVLAMRLRPNGFIQKPFDSSLFIYVVGSLLHE